MTILLLFILGTAQAQSNHDWSILFPEDFETPLNDYAKQCVGTKLMLNLLPSNIQQLNPTLKNSVLDKNIDLSFHESNEGYVRFQTLPKKEFIVTIFDMPGFQGTRTDLVFKIGSCTPSKAYLSCSGDPAILFSEVKIRNGSCVVSKSRKRKKAASSDTTCPQLLTICKTLKEHVTNANGGAQ